MEIWSATSEGYSFVISYESPPVQAFTDVPVIWRRGVRFMKARDQDHRLAPENFRRGRSRLRRDAETPDERLGLREAIYAAARSSLSALRITIFISAL
jgi:hypothetical protein